MINGHKKEGGKATLFYFTQYVMYFTEQPVTGGMRDGLDRYKWY